MCLSVTTMGSACGVVCSAQRAERPATLGPVPHEDGRFYPRSHGYYYCFTLQPTRLKFGSVAASPEAQGQA